jgi:ribosomal-protein-alanine N-acetyltransferase
MQRRCSRFICTRFEMPDIDFPYVVEPMRWSDVPHVMTIERESFSLPWPKRAYHYELSQNEQSHYVVLRSRSAPASGARWERLRRLWQRGRRAPVLAYGGFWLVAGKAHVSTLAVAPAWRKRGLGELVFWHMLDRAISLGADEATLEVRVSNHAAQNLYLKYGFERVGQRRHYYQDNGEDAWIMALKGLDGGANRACLNRLGQALRGRLWREVEKQAPGQSAVVGL